MENASKALLIAGEILIAILIISSALYLISSYGSTADRYQETISVQEIEKFNNQFLKYIEYENGKAKISAENLITIGNLAGDICKEDEPEKLTITVSFLGNQNQEIQKEISGKIDKYYKEVTKEDITSMQMVMYNVSIIYEDNGRIKTITAST